MKRYRHSKKKNSTRKTVLALTGALALSMGTILLAAPQMTQAKTFSIGSASRDVHRAAAEQTAPEEVTLPAGFYGIRGATLPLQEKGYRKGDYRGAGQCWQFAQHIYYNIWDCFFYQNAGSEDDMLRDYPGGEYRRITAENARFFISEAPIGSVIRIQAVLDGPDSTSGNRHSLILLDKTEDGCTLYHDWKGYSTISTLTWKEFETMFRTNIDFGYFKYIKYPSARALLYNDTTEEMTRELLISSRIYGTVELVEKKQ